MGGMRCYEKYEALSTTKGAFQLKQWRYGFFWHSATQEKTLKQQAFENKNTQAGSVADQQINKGNS